MASLASGILVLDLAMDTTPPPPPRASFRQRCAASLTHPVTLLAVLVLLLNDLVLKALWSNPWTTGKLSDLAWVIFASPLLVILLSPLAGGNTLRQRVAFLTAYVGLPVLYAAFNTFQSLHDWIMGGFGLLTNGSAGSPLDVTDSLVIPFGLAVALWVWRHSGAGLGSLRTRLTLIAVGVAVFATIATSPSPVDYGIRHIEVGEDGTLRARVYYHNASLYVYFLSLDGGQTWTVPEMGSFSSTSVSADRADTPRGSYVIEELDVVAESKDGSREVVYSSPPWSDANVWIQSKVMSLENRGLAAKPYSIIYHEQSGNVILAVGIKGVVIGTPDGRWAPVAVTNYESADFSRLNKMATLLSDPFFWIPSVAVALSFSLLALVLSPYKAEGPLLDEGGGPRLDCRLVTALASAIFSALLLITYVGLLGPVGSEDIFGDLPPEFSLHASVFVYMFCFLAYVLGRKQFKRWRVLSMGLAIITLILIVVFSTWIQTGIAHWVAKFSALVLSGLAVWALTKLYARSQGNSILRDAQTQKN